MGARAVTDDKDEGIQDASSDLGVATLALCGFVTRPTSGHGRSCHRASSPGNHQPVDLAPARSTREVELGREGTVMKVLVVDDEVGYRRGLEYVLSRAGHEVRTAPGSDEALVLGQSFVPDILVVDWLLQNRGNGLDLARELTKTNPALKTILMTACASDDLRFVMERASVFRVIEKPFDPRELVSAVQEAAGINPQGGARGPAGPPPNPPGPAGD